MAERMKRFMRLVPRGCWTESIVPSVSHRQRRNQKSHAFSATRHLLRVESLFVSESSQPLFKAATEKIALGGELLG